MYKYFRLEKNIEILDLDLDFVLRYGVYYICPQGNKHLKAICPDIQTAAYTVNAYTSLDKKELEE